MKATLATILLILSVFELRPAAVQSGPLEVLAEFPGSSLKWVHIAEPIFQQKKLALDKYNVIVFDEGGDSVTVILEPVGLPATARGGGGFEVEISKKDGKVLDSHFDR